MKKKASLIACIIGLVLSAVAIYCAKLPIRALIAASETLGTDEKTVRILTTLGGALLKQNWLLLLPGTLLTALPVYRFQITKRTWLKILCVLIVLILFPALIVTTIVTMHAGSLSIFTILKLLIQLTKTGA